MSRIQSGFSKVAAQDLSGPTRTRPTAMPSTHDFASMLNAGNDGSVSSAHADTRSTNGSRHDEASSSRRTDSSPPADRLTSKRIEQRTDAASNVNDGQRPAADSAATATATGKDSAPPKIAGTKGETERGASTPDTDQGDGKADAGNGAVTATVAMPAIVPASGTAVVQPSVPTLDGATADNATSVSAAALTVTAHSDVQSGAADTAHAAAEPGEVGAEPGRAETEQGPAKAEPGQVTKGNQPSATALLTALAHKKAGSEALVNDESEPAEAAKKDPAPESLSPADKPAKGGKFRTVSAASASAPTGEPPTADEQQVQPLAQDLSDGAKAHLTTETVPEDVQPHVHALRDAESVAGNREKKEASDDGAAVRTSEPRIGAVEATATASSASSISSVGAHAGIGAIGNTSAGAASATAAPLVHRTDAATTAVPVTDLGVEIATQATAGRRSFDIRLDPAELGHIHVRLDVDRDGNVVSRLVVDRAETLDLLRRDAPQLERALQDAGLKTDAQTMQFSLRHQNAGQQDGQTPQRSAALAAEVDTSARPDEVPLSYGRLASRAGGLDIRI